LGRLPAFLCFFFLIAVEASPRSLPTLGITRAR